MKPNVQTCTWAPPENQIGQDPEILGFEWLNSENFAKSGGYVTAHATPASAHELVFSGSH